MPRRLLITGAGGAATSNLIRSLHAADPSLAIIGCHHDRFALKRSSAQRNYLTPLSASPDFPDTLLRIIDKEQIDLVIPNNDLDVKIIAALRDTVPCRLFLPRKHVIELCQDKYDLTVYLRSRQLPAPLTFSVTDLERLEAVFEELAPHRELWCRIRTGSNARGALRVNHPDQARSWIKYWEMMRGVSPTSFTLSEYLPGRDFLCHTLWKDGIPVLMKTFERLAYLGGASNPTSVSALARTVVDERLAAICVQVVSAVDSNASGAFSIDLKEDAAGNPLVTEINAGRFLMAMNAFDVTGSHNMAITYVRLGLDEAVDIRNMYDTVEEYYVVRDFDMPPEVFRAEEFFEGIEEL